MATIRELNKWANAHTNYPTDIVRIAFGAFLFFKGISFITERKYFYEALDSMNGFGMQNKRQFRRCTEIKNCNILEHRGQNVQLFKISLIMRMGHLTHFEDL